MNFRKEFKIRLSPFDSMKLERQLLDQGMEELYPARKIQSMYFDNRTFQMFHDSEEGSLPRKKIRIRHYPESPSEKLLEIKVSSVEGRFKTSEPVSEEAQKRLYRHGHMDNLYGVCLPVAEVLYTRKYFQFHDMRVTFDHYIGYRALNASSFIREHEVVTEIKVSNGYPDDAVKKLIDVPFSRFSKYSRAVLATGLKT